MMTFVVNCARKTFYDIDDDDDDDDDENEDENEDDDEDDDENEAGQVQHGEYG